MLAPSPDWFVAANAIHLCENNVWIEKEMDLVGYDAGSRIGDTY